MSRLFSEDDYRHATGYPWQRPEGSYLLRHGEVEPLDDAAQLSQLAGGERTALIAFGSNGAPDVLRRKLSSLPDPGELAVLTGHLEGFEIVPSAHVAIYGALPATIVRAPEGHARASLLLVDDAQLDVIGLTEWNYHIVRLAPDEFAADIELPAPTTSLAYVSRHGRFAPTGHDTGAMSQAELLELAAGLVIGEGADGRELVRRTLEDYRWAIDVAIPALAEHAEHFDRALWEVVHVARAELES